MNKALLLFATAALCSLLTSCSTPQPRVAFHNTDNSALVVASYNNGTCQVIGPIASSPEKNGLVVDQIKPLAQRQTAVIILENYSEPTLGPEFHARAYGWFAGLRCLGYQHIVFLQGNGAPNPDSLPTLFEYD
ncbi:MAG TPA: hypothetical protein VG347_23225 [Verrucomicrobiae bacterium]|nr:hypothetical protein [Verrucomicrobiae bacterium]